MSSDVPGRPPVGRLLDVLQVRRNVAVGFAVGGGVAVAIYAVRVLELLGPAPTRGSPALFLALALVFALSAGALVATALTLATAVRVAREGGTVGDADDAREDR